MQRASTLHSPPRFVSLPWRPRPATRFTPPAPPVSWSTSPPAAWRRCAGLPPDRQLPWSILADTTESIVVDDGSVTAARHDLWSQYQLAVEPAAAVTLAALQTGAYRPESGERVVAVVCGGNTDPADLFVS